jgi:hypothetical protein
MPHESSLAKRRNGERGVEIFTGTAKSAGENFTA